MFLKEQITESLGVVYRGGGWSGPDGFFQDAFQSNATQLSVPLGIGKHTGRGRNRSRRLKSVLRLMILTIRHCIFFFRSLAAPSNGTGVFHTV